MTTFREVTVEMIVKAPLVTKHKELLIAFRRNGANTAETIEFLEAQTAPEGILNAVIMTAYLKHERVVL